MHMFKILKYPSIVNDIKFSSIEYICSLISDTIALMESNHQLLLPQMRMNIIMTAVCVCARSFS